MTNMNIPLIKINKDDRAPDSNLKPETRHRLINSIKNYLTQIGYVNISEIAEAIGISRPTARNLVDEIVREWWEDSKDHIVVQEQWYKTVLEDIDSQPETFSKDKIELIKLKSAIFSRINSLHKLHRRNNVA